MPAKFKLVFGIGFLLTCPCPIFGQDASANARRQEKPITPQVAEPTLRDLGKARNLHIGAAVTSKSLKAGKEILSREFSLLVSENGMTWDKINPNKGSFNWNFADHFVEFAIENKFDVKGASLVWHAACPEYLTRLSATELRAEIDDHIKAKVGRYKGKIQRWDVVNEALDDNGKDLRKSIFLEKLGPSYIADCFVAAHKADPSAILIYNDYGCEGMGPKSDRLYDLIKSLRSKKVPVHEVGLQMHIFEGKRAKPEELRKNVQRLTKLGVKVNISEMDVAFNGLPGKTPEERLKVQADIYQEVLGACVDIEGFSGVTFWGFSDRFTWVDWLNRNNPHAVPESPLLFDREYKKKPAYFAVEEVLLVKNKKR